MTLIILNIIEWTILLGITIAVIAIIRAIIKT
jgi:hypothetical protein